MCFRIMALVPVHNVHSNDVALILTFRLSMKIPFFLTILSFVFTASHAQNVTTIDLTQAIIGQIPANRIFKDMKYVRLETHKDALLNVDWATFYLTDEYIIALNGFTPGYLFDRETGAFIREISSVGRGPNQYQGMFYRSYGFDETNYIIFAGTPSRKGWSCINIITNKISIIPIPSDKEASSAG